MEGKAYRLAIGSLLFSMSAVLWNPNVRAQEPLATVSVQTQTLGIEIPKDFVGISLEVSTAGQGIGAFAPGGTPPAPGSRVAEYALGIPEAPNTVFFQFLRNLGPGILRLGGNSQDNTCWNPSAAPHPESCKGELRSSDFRVYSIAAKESGWRLILGINLKQNSSQWALNEIKEGIAKEIHHDQVLGLELGNEPDLFSRDGSRPQTYSPADQVKDFAAYAHAFEQDSIGKQYALIGPATCCKWRNPEDLGIFVDGIEAFSPKLITVHSYLLTTCGDRKVTIAELLAPELMTRFNKEAQGLVEIARKRKLPIALAETNSASCGGMPGVSNAFASTLWGIDSLFSAAEDGYSGVNFHFSYRPGGSSYNPVDTYKQVDGNGREQYENFVQPLYYAMYLFAKSASGKHLLQVSTETKSNVRAYATSACATCPVSVLILNKDESASGRVRIQVPNRAAKATLLLLKAPKLDSLSSEVTYGGVQFDRNGRIPTPHTQKISPDSNHNYEFDLPIATVALLLTD